MAGQKKWRRRLAAAAALLLIAAVLAVGFLRPAAPPLLSTKAITLAPGVHMLGNLVPAAAYVVETSEGLVLIDAGLEHDAKELKRQMGQLGLDWTKLRAILLTHVHLDHTGGAEHLRAKTGAKIYAGAADAPLLKAGGPQDAFFTTFHMPGYKAAPTTVDVELVGDSEFTLGEARFHVLATPGHSPGSVCYLMERNGLRVMFAGDVVMALSGSRHNAIRLGSRVGRPLGTYTAHLAPRYLGDAKDFLASLKKLKAVPVPDLLLPGHPRLDDQPQNPRLSPERWATLFDEGIQEMEMVLARNKRDGANFLDSTPRRLLPDLYYFGEFEGAASYGLIASKNLFLVGVVRGPGLSEFVQARFQQLGLTPVPPSAILLTACGPDEIAGLEDLVAKTNLQVVASAEGLEKVRAACPRAAVLAAQELPKQGWLDVKAMPLRGRGLGPVAYTVRWADKTVLFSGRLPIQDYPLGFEALNAEIAQGRARSADCLASINQIADINPDLWLPALPLYGQNANLYDKEWADIIDYNRQRFD